jgi:hypothetical protein
MEAARTRWPDERIDDLKATVDRIDSRIDALHRTMVIGFLSIAGLFVSCFGAMFTLFATHF